ncbi:cupin domain-containing protein [Methylobacterium oryzae CBMB20]
MTPLGERRAWNLFHMVLKQGSSTGNELFSHDSEEASLVLEGRLFLVVEARTLKLSEEDCFCFESRKLHRFNNPRTRGRTVVP